MSNEKKIAKYERYTENCLEELEKLYLKLTQTEDSAKIAKLEKKVGIRKENIKYYIDNVLKAGGKIESVIGRITAGQKEILEEIYPSGTDSETINIEKEIAFIKKHLNEELPKIEEKHSYDPNSPIEEKDKNPLFRKEAWIGGYLRLAGDQDWEKKYKECWNYARDYESTKDKYFSQNEQEIIVRCIASYDEQQAYYDIKYGFIRNAGKKLRETAQKMDSWGDITQARMWARNFYEDLFPKTVKLIYGDISKSEIQQKAKEMTRRYIEFINNPEEIQEMLELEEEMEKEAANLLRELKTSGKLAENVLERRNLKELKTVLELAETEIEGQNAMIYQLVREKVGTEKADFLVLYKFDKIIDQKRELLNQYSYEELGL